jgi:hypothetical protein
MSNFIVQLFFAVFDLAWSITFANENTELDNKISKLEKEIYSTQWDADHYDTYESMMSSAINRAREKAYTKGVTGIPYFGVRPYSVAECQDIADKKKILLDDVRHQKIVLSRVNVARASTISCIKFAIISCALYFGLSRA